MPRTRAVCKKGHVVSRDVTEPLRRSALDTRGIQPVQYQIDKFCQECGAPVIVACPSCETPIPNPRNQSFAMPGASPFCGACGEPFPWATREERAGQLVALLDHEDLDQVTRLSAIEAIEKLVGAAPDDDETQVEASGRLRKVAGKAWDAMLPVVQSLMTSAAKEQLGLP